MSLRTPILRPAGGDHHEIHRQSVGNLPAKLPALPATGARPEGKAVTGEGRHERAQLLGDYRAGLLDLAAADARTCRIRRRLAGSGHATGYTAGLAGGDW